MQNNFKKDFEKTRNFYEKNKDIILSTFNNETKIYNIEFDNSELANLLDLNCGIDYMILSNKRVLGVAARINFNKNHHNNITIRYKRATGAKTEFQKRCESIIKHKGDIYASITMQIDANNEEIQRIIIFESDKLYLSILKDIEYYENNYMQINHIDNNKFFKINYNDLLDISTKENFKVKIKEFKNAI